MPCRALLLAIPRECRRGTTRLVPERILQVLDRRFDCGGHLHAARYHLHPRRPAQGESPARIRRSQRPPLTTPAVSE